MRRAVAALVVALLLTGFSVAAPAQDLPALHDVTGVAADDQLNIRAEPSASAPVLGGFAPGTAGVEVTGISPDGGWGRVNLNERAGWVSMRFLARQPGPDWWHLAQPLSCYGTEPFWSLRLDADARRLNLSRMGGDPVDLVIDWSADVSGRRGQAGMALRGPDSTGFAALTGQDCSDGMSDFSFGIALSLFLSGEGTADGSVAQGLSGCCSLAR
ncbi:SH3 domain-containing protein [Szabonella alba]|uniref:SH3 domain-containing protein n=1 Tax=Szabonella alba TaxID=2804194 RepID=A0A8K0V7F5_9RHOB|nr:SH3 domain-containing protein [Szabonella alba]MBL4916526.1 SH3 domain-containing protein [Szabonella alba]